MKKSKSFSILIIGLLISASVSAQNELSYDCVSSAKFNPELLIIGEAYLTTTSSNYNDYTIKDNSSLTAEALTLDKDLPALYTKKAIYLQDSIFVKDYMHNPDQIWVNQDFIVKDWSKSVETNSLCIPNSQYKNIIIEIQDSLFHNGYPETPRSGEMCNLTLSNLMLFQIQNTLPIGNLNEETISLLLNKKTNKSNEYNFPWIKGNIKCKFKYLQEIKRKRTEVIEDQCLCPSNKGLDKIQTQIEVKLSEMYYDVDGYFGLTTKRSLAEYQIEHNRPIGFFDLKTLDLLGIKYE